MCRTVDQDGGSPMAEGGEDSTHTKPSSSHVPEQDKLHVSASTPLYLLPADCTGSIQGIPFLTTNIQTALVCNSENAIFTRHTIHPVQLSAPAHSSRTNRHPKLMHQWCALIHTYTQSQLHPPRHVHQHTLTAGSGGAPQLNPMTTLS